MNLSIIHAANAVCARLGVKAGNVATMEGRRKHPRYGTWAKVRGQVFTELLSMGFAPKQIGFYFDTPPVVVRSSVNLWRSVREEKEGSDDGPERTGTSGISETAGDVAGHGGPEGGG